MITSTQPIKDVGILSQQKEDMNVSTHISVSTALTRWVLTESPADSLTLSHPSSLSPTPLCLSVFPHLSVFLLLCLLLFSLPSLFFSSASSCVLAVLGNEEPYNWLALLVGTILSHEAAEKNNSPLEGLWLHFPAELTVCLHPTFHICLSVYLPASVSTSASLSEALCLFLTLSLSLGLHVFLYFSLCLSLSLVLCVCVCVWACACVCPFSCERWAPGALWRPSCGKEEGKRPQILCASSYLGVWLKRLFSQTRIAVSTTWQAVPGLQGVRSLLTTPEVAGTLSNVSPSRCLSKAEMTILIKTTYMKVNWAHIQWHTWLWLCCMVIKHKWWEAHGNDCN